ncbi:MAG: glycerophosphodiester phosphodiesterase [Deltaproteobacteria bacterium]|nr:glycerophosphodiester phosphodiesterase [Deltaproteobacteria bacterium]MBW2255752.1 glycerophosphodiester phosphodiesterase [Deltaproteobacteria bacterium]
MSPIALALAAALVLAPDARAGALPESTAVIAHRGASGHAPENTMAAFEAAARLGVGFELDVTLCKSGEVVVIHDDTVDRTTEGSGAAADLTLDEIKALDAGSFFDPDFAGEPIPTLDEVLATYGGRVPIDIEIKSTTPREPLADAVVAAIERAGLVEEVFVTSFDPYMLERVKEQNPDILRGQLTGTFKDADLCFIEKLFLRNMWLNGKSEPGAIAVERVRARKRFVKRQHRKGRDVLVWTVNEPEEMERLLDLEVEAIITDFPDVLLEVLERRESPSASTP